MGRQAWLVRLRWIAILGVLAVVSVAARNAWVPDPAPLYGVVGLMIAYNLLFRRAQRSGRVPARESRDQVLFMQILCDMGALTMLLHWSGGVENPFAMFFAFHMAISAMLLPSRSSYLLGLAATALFGGTVVAEHLGRLPHYPLQLYAARAAPGAVSGPLASGPMLAGYLLAFVLMLFGVTFFVQTVEARRLRAERLARERERIALSRERMARIGEISSGVLHTIRNPLHGIMNCVDLLRGQVGPEPDPETEELLSFMSEGIARIENVTRRLLTVTRDQPLAKKRVRLDELIEEALKFVTQAARRGEAALEMEIHDLPAVEVDPDRLSEIIINLLDNALFACRAGGVVTLLAYAGEPARSEVCIEIRDTGAGIPADQLAKVFDPFFTTKAIGEGSGLGLAIARKVVEEHDGRIELESEVGKGTTVRVLLPASGAAADAVRDRP